MKSFKNILTKVSNSFLAFFLCATSLFTNAPTIKAQEFYKPTTVGLIQDAGAKVGNSSDYAFWKMGLYKIAVDGEIAFCIEPTTVGLGGNYSKYENIPMALQKPLSLIVYYGWDTTAKTNDDYATTQYMIWEKLGYSPMEWYGDFGNRYPQLKNNVQQKIDKHDLRPDFDNNSYEVDLGTTLTLNDSRNVLQDYYVKSDGGANVSISGNSLKITPTATTPNNITIKINKVLDRCLGASIAFRSSADDGQDVAIFKVADPSSYSINVKVNKYGDMLLKKVNQDREPVPNTEFKVSYNADMSSPIGTYTTGSNGTVRVEKLQPRKVYIQEVSVPAPLILDRTIHEKTIIANDTVEFTATNDFKTGDLEIKKLDVDTKKPITRSNAEFKIYKSDDTFVATVTTNDKGVAALPNVRYGDYYFVETRAPEGYTLNSTHVPFEIRENGVTVKKSLSNKRVVGTINLTKVDKETGNVAQGDATLEGAVYELKAKENIVSPDDGHTLYNKGTVVKTLTIKNGKAKAENLYMGKYEIKEKTAPKGYLLSKTAHEIILTSTSQNKATEIRNVTDSEQVKKRAFQIIKISSDGESGTTPTLKGAHFQVKLKSELEKVGGKWQDAKLYDELVTNDDGYAKSIELPYGTYVVRETVVPPNHTKVKDFEVNIPDDSREPLSWVVQNDKPTTSLIGIVKVDSETGDVVRLPGATFKIKNLDTDEYVGFWVYGSSLGQYVTEFTTNKDGNAMTPGTVRAGHYVLEEIKAPDGMLIAHESKPFTISDDDVQQIAPDGINYITTVQFADAPAKGQLVLEKTADIFQGYEAKETEYGTLYQPVFEEGLLANVTYEIRAREDIKSADGTRTYHYRGDLVERITTNGRTTTKSSRLPLGAYTVQEIACDDPSYVIDSNIYEFDLIYKDQETPVVKQTMKLYDDRKQGTGTITKVIEDSEIIDNSDVYEDIKFGVFTANNLLVNGNKVLNKDSMIQVVSLDDMYKGKVQVDFAGSYYLRELATNDQYVLSGTKIPFNFNYTEDKEIVIEINNGKPIENKVKRGDIQVLKKDSVTGQPVAGAVFEFSRDRDFENILATVTSDANGIAKLENIEKSTVYVREKTAPDGYAKNTSVKKAEIEENGQVIEFVYENEAYRGWITLHKTDIATKDNLTGIIYKVVADEDIYAIGHPVDENGNKIIAYHKGDVVDTGISENGLYATDETGTIFIGGENGLPMGKYAIFEVETLEGYVLDPLQHIVTISPDSETSGIIEREVFADNDFTKVEVSKTDITTHEHIKGATMQIINKDNGKVVYEWISDGTTKLFERVPVGNYILHEEKAPENSGYLLANDIEFTVQERTDIQSVEMKEDYTKFDISKTDIATGKEIIGATLQIKDKDGNVVHEWVTDGKPHRIEYLPIDTTFILHEEYVADGYVHAEDIEFTVEETGEIQKVEMKDDYTKFDISKTDITTGKEIIGATLQIKDKDGNVVHEWVTDGKPHRIEYLPIDTTFILHEEYVADGYVHAEDIEFTVEETGEIQKVNMKDDYTRTIISKIDKETGELLTGADLQLYYVAKDKADVKNDSDPLAKYDLVDEWKSGNEPKLFERLKVGKYILHEKKAPYGYETAQDITFEIVETEKPLKITMEDIKIRSYVKIKKVDEDNHDKVLKGVEFTLYTDKDCTKPLMTKTTNDNGEIIFENLTYQTLYVKETKAAAGYQLSNEVVKIVINDEWLKSDKTLVFGNKLIPSVSTGDNTALPLTLGLFMLSGLCLIVCKKKMQK